MCAYPIPRIIISLVKSKFSVGHSLPHITLNPRNARGHVRLKNHLPHAVEMDFSTKRLPLTRTKARNRLAFEWHGCYMPPEINQPTIHGSFHTQAHRYLERKSRWFSHHRQPNYQGRMRANGQPNITTRLRSLDELFYDHRSRCEIIRLFRSRARLLSPTCFFNCLNNNFLGFFPGKIGNR